MIRGRITFFLAIPAILWCSGASVSAESLRLQILTRGENLDSPRNTPHMSVQDGWGASYEQSGDIGWATLGLGQTDCPDAVYSHAFFNVEEIPRMTSMIAQLQFGPRTGQVQNVLAADQTVAWAKLCDAAREMRDRELSQLATMTH